MCRTPGKSIWLWLLSALWIFAPAALAGTYYVRMDGDDSDRATRLCIGVNHYTGQRLYWTRGRPSPRWQKAQADSLDQQTAARIAAELMSFCCGKRSA